MAPQSIEEDRDHEIRAVKDCGSELPVYSAIVRRQECGRKRYKCDPEKQQQILKKQTVVRALYEIGRASCRERV